MIGRDLRIALRVLARNKVRSALTMLGIIIGVAAVIAMVSIGQGATSAVKASIASMGQNLLMVMPGSTSSGGFSMGFGSVQTLTPGDAAAIARECPSAENVAVVVRTSGQVVYQSANWAPSTVQGVDPAFFEVRDWTIADGEAFTEADVRVAAQVAVLGRTIVRQLFGDEDAVGKMIRVKGLPFKVVAVLGAKGASTFGSDQDDALYMPWTTAKKKLKGNAFDTVDQILAVARSAETVPTLQAEMTDLLRVRHRIRQSARGDYEDDFTIRDMTEMLNAMTATTRVMTGLLAAIASISLLVGGIGIMNILLVSVTERTREIGLRMAVGARGGDILGQFLVEAVVLSGLGGMIGTALGAGAALVVARVFGWPAAVTPQLIAIAIGFSSAVGIFFGFYPALQASKLDPIEALRYE